MKYLLSLLVVVASILLTTNTTVAATTSSMSGPAKADNWDDDCFGSKYTCAVVVGKKIPK